MWRAARAVDRKRRVGHDEVAALVAAAGGGTRVGSVATSDLFYDRDRTRARAWAQEGAVAVEMEAAALLRVGELRGVAIACLLTVSDVFDEDGARHRLDADGLVRAGERLGEVAAAALAVAACAGLDPATASP